MTIKGANNILLKCMCMIIAKNYRIPSTLHRTRLKQLNKENQTCP